MQENSCCWPPNLRNILFTSTSIKNRLDELTREIESDYQGKSLTVLTLLNGALPFAADLIRRLNLPLQLESLHVSSYHGTLKSSGNVRFDLQTLPDLRDKDVLIVDDILDTGITLNAIHEGIRTHFVPRSLKTCVLLNKQVERHTAVDADYSGFDIENQFVVGYGLDYQGYYRNLPYIGVLSPLKPRFIHE